MDQPVLGTAPAASGSPQPPRPSSGGRGGPLSLWVAGAAFLLSGAAALVYEATWSRYLGLFLGHSAYAQAIVLITFLGGMALGALAAGSGAAARRRPWLVYVAVELGIGVLGLSFHPVYLGITGWAYEHLLPALPSGPAVILARWALAVALIAPASILLGATFPLLAVGAMRRIPAEPGRVLGLLYFANGIGGALGVLVGGFVLLGAVGLPGTMVAAGLTNLLVAGLVAAAELGRRGAPQAAPPPAPPLEAAPPAADPAGLRLRRVLLTVAFGTAAASLIYEIAWTRMLSLVLGSATHSFELMLSAYLLGLALGAWWIRRRADRFRDPLRVLGRIQWIMGGLALATLPLYLASFRWTAALLAALDLTPEGYTLYTLARYGLCLIVMLPATFCAGMTLPLITRTLVRGGAGEPAVGLVYGVNTVGSIVGVGLGALVLLPLIGLKALLFTGAVVDMGLGAWLLAFAGPEASARRRVLLATLGGVVLLAGTAWVARFDRAVLTSGVFRTRVVAETDARRVVYYHDGATATVSATLQQSGAAILATNGKPDASLPAAWLTPPPLGARPGPLSGDGSTQALLALVTLAHAARPETVAVIGQGAGMSSHLLLGDPRVQTLTTIEIEPSMIAGSNVFYPANRRVFDDPRARFVIEDARAELAAAGTRYDLIMSEPSNPWVSGVSGLFTTEFYDLIARHLTDDGVFGQWLHLYEMTDELVLSVVAALDRTFPSYTLYHTEALDVLVVASRRPTLPVPDWSVTRQPAIAADLAMFHPLSAETLDALRLADHDALAPLVADGIRANSDFWPVLDLGAERARYLGGRAQGFAALTAPRFDPFAALAGRRTPLPRDPLTAVPSIPPARAAALSARLRAAPDGRDTLPADRAFSAAAMRRATLEAWLARRVAPPDWQGWISQVVLVEHDLHGRAQGVADERFYAALRRYLAATRPPLQAVAAVDFMHGLAAWDFAEAARSADRLSFDASLGEGWVPATMLLDGGVVAKLRTGDVAGARALYDELTPVLGGVGGLRARLIEAHLRVAEAKAR